MKKSVFTLLLFLALFVSLTGCTFSLVGKPQSTPTAVIWPTLAVTSTLPTEVPASPTPVFFTVTPLLPSPTSQAGTATNTPLPTATNGDGGPVVVNSPSGPYGVILVASNDVLNVRSGPGADYTAVGTFAPTETSVMRTGLSKMVGDNLWVEVQKAGGGTGWVNSSFLTEYVSPSTFCADAKVNTLIANFVSAVKNSDGERLATLVSPLHGIRVNLWRGGNTISFFPEFARWMFVSTYPHNWGPDGARGEDAVGSFHEVVLPKMLDVMNAAYVLGCNDSSHTGSILEPWPATYTNINFYSLYKPGTPGVDLDWHTSLVGVEYMEGQPYVFAIINYQWEP